jgi:hypothetical protein
MIDSVLYNVYLGGGGLGHEVQQQEGERRVVLWVGRQVYATGRRVVEVVEGEKTRFG